MTDARKSVRRTFARNITRLQTFVRRNRFDPLLVRSLDWLLLTKSRFFQRYYPETEGCAGYHSFGFNRKEQLIRLAVFPFVAVLMAFLSLWIGGKL